MRVQNNIAALNSNRMLASNTSQMNKSLERLSSGYRINTAADDAAGMSASMRFRSEISSLGVASRNAAEATSLLQVSEGAMSQVDLILNRMKELSTQAASANAGDDLSKINAEATALESEIGRIVSFTKYGGKTLLDGSFGATTLSSGATIEGFEAGDGVENIDVSNAEGIASFHVSALDTDAETFTLEMTDASSNTVSQSVSYTTQAALGDNEDYTFNFSELGVSVTVNNGFDASALDADAVASNADRFYSSAVGDATFQIGSEDSSSSQMGFSIGDLSLATLANGSSADIDLSSQSTAQAALTTIDNAISYLAAKRGEVGALVNRLGYAQSNLAVSVENKTASESVIRDVDMASEMSEFTKSQILVQSSISMLAQANVSPQNVLSLL